MDSIWAKSVKMPELPFPVAGTIGFANQAQFHPLKFLSQIVHKLNIYEHTFVKELQENTADVKGMYVDEAMCGMSFRNYKDYLLIGGGDHRTGKKGGNWQELRDFAGKYYPSAREAAAWATQDCMILERENPYREIFNPSRNMIKPQLLLNGFEATKNLFTITKKRCPHMGCALKWNAVEHS